MNKVENGSDVEIEKNCSLAIQTASPGANETMTTVLAEGNSTADKETSKLGQNAKVKDGPTATKKAYTCSGPVHLIAQSLTLKSNEGCNSKVTYNSEPHIATLERGEILDKGKSESDQSSGVTVPGLFESNCEESHNFEKESDCDMKDATVEKTLRNGDDDDKSNSANSALFDTKENCRESPKAMEIEPVQERSPSVTGDSCPVSSSKSNEETSLKHLAAKYTCIGPVHLVPRTITSTSATKPTDSASKDSCCTSPNNNETAKCVTSMSSIVTRMPVVAGSAAESDKQTVSGKRTEKFIVKNVSKVSKMFKVSNLNYRIKPVRKNLATKFYQCPVIYVGEPAFIDPEDFSDYGIPQQVPGPLTSSTPEVVSNLCMDIKEESLYDISSLKNVFIPPTSASLVTTNESCHKVQFPYTDLAQPSFVPRTDLKSLLSAPNYMYTNTRFLNTVPPNLNGTYRIVARTVPSATMAGTVITNSVSGYKPKSARFSPYRKPPSKLAPLTVVVPYNQGSFKQTIPLQGTINLPSKFNATISSPIMTISQEPVQVVSSTPSQKGLPHNMPSAPSAPLSSNPGHMTVKILPSTTHSNATAIKTGSLKQPTPRSVGILSSLPNVTRVIPVNTGGSGVLGCAQPTKAIFVPATKTHHAPLSSDKTANMFLNKPMFRIEQKSNPASSALAKIASEHGSTENDIVVNYTTVKSTFDNASSVSTLREGVEVAFEDGVRHFITSLRQMTFLDDESVKSWSQLKKGTKVAAKWKDGFIYDATVVACYFSADKKATQTVEEKNVERSPEKSKGMQPVVKLVKISDKSVVQYREKPNQKSTIGCTGCREVFPSVISFRKHQRRVCKSPGVILNEGTSKITDAILEAASKHKKVVAINNPKSTEDKNKVEKDKKITCKRATKCDVMKKHLKKIRIKGMETPEVVKKANPDTSEKSSLFKIGTKFLHRWQLDGGASKWYQGEVTRVISMSKAFLDREFEVRYKGEEEIYTLKLYEDYPADIRIMG